MKNKKGMTLVEVLVASVIVGIIAVGMLGVFVVAKKPTYKAGDKITALGDVRTKILEEVTGKEYNFAEHWEAVKNYGGLVDATGSYGSLPGEGWQIEETTSSTSLNNITYPYKQVDFTLSWTKR